MTEPVAPTLREILVARYDLMVSCDPCRSIRPMDALELALRRPDNVPVDQFTFRCGKCRKAGQVWVKGPGNCTMGFPQIWPPASAS